MPPVLVFGSTGLIGEAVCRIFGQRGAGVDPLTRRDVDLADYAAVEARIMNWAQNHPDGVVINCAAMTNLDACEQQPWRAHAVNVVAPTIMSLTCRLKGLRSVMFSTDHIFDSSDDTFYRHHEEDSPFDPHWTAHSIYGRGKAQAEQHVRLSGGMVIRTQWVYGHGHPTWIDSVIAQARSGEPVEALTDYHGIPSFADDIAEALWTIVGDPTSSGIYHLINEGTATSRFSLAIAALKACHQPATVIPATMDTMSSPWLAWRPKRSLLQNHRGPKLPPWLDSLTAYLQTAAAVSSSPVS